MKLPKLPFTKEKKSQEEVMDKIERLDDALKEKKRSIFSGMLFFKGKKQNADAAPGKAEKQSLPEKKLPQGLAKLKALSRRKILTSKKKRRFDLRRFAKSIDLHDFLEKAGMERLDPRKVTRDMLRVDIIICLTITAVITILNIFSGKGLLSLITFLMGFWLTVPFVVLALIWGVYLFYLDMRIFKRTNAVEAVFPDFLQLTSANISAGMPIDRALWYAVRPGFGVLAKEIESVAKNTMAGEDLGSALTNFANKYKSRTIQRSISLLLEGMSAGG
jgi:pilus assembly protein TadC